MLNTSLYYKLNYVIVIYNLIIKPIKIIYKKGLNIIYKYIKIINFIKSFKNIVKALIIVTALITLAGNYMPDLKKFSLTFSFTTKAIFFY